MENQNITHSVTGKVIAIPAVAAFILGTALIGATFIGGNTFYKVRALDNTLSVVGSTKMRVESDTAKWSPTITRTVDMNGLSEGMKNMQSDAGTLKKYLLEKGLKDTDITIGTPNYNKDTFYDQAKGPVDRGYIINVPVIINTENIDTLIAITNDQSALVSRGITFQGYGPVEYFYTKLPELRVSLLGEATKDARARAEKIASESSATVGRIKSASSGVVQILAPNSIDQVTDYGGFDTSSRAKDVMVTVRATFQLK